LVAVFGVAVLYRGGLSFPVYKDEYWYWRQTLSFVSQWPLSVEELRNYQEPMPPLSFVIWAGVERAFGAGVAGARIVTMLMSVSVLCVVGLRLRPPGRSALLAAVGLLIFPYYVPLSIHIYTDIPAALFVLLGFWLYAHRLPLWSGIAFALGVATRQYMVVFPAALAVAELAPAVFAPAGGTPLAGRLRRTLPVVAGGASLLGWFLFFGGIGPDAGLEMWPRHNVALSHPVPGFGLYALSCIGAYFVIPEFLLYRRWRHTRLRISRWGAVLAAVVLAAYAILSPLSQDASMGPLNRVSISMLSSDLLGGASTCVRLVLFAGLAWLTGLRFPGLGLTRVNLVFWLLLAHFTTMMVSFEAWEKYNLTILVVLWYLRSIDDLDGPMDLWNARTSPRDGGAGS
jgi:hypothetical protein